MGDWLGDLRVAARGLWKRPLFAVVAAGSLSIGIGANTAVFSAASALLLRPVPGVENHERVVEVGRTYRSGGFSVFAYRDFLDIRGSVPALEEGAAFAIRPLSVATTEGGVRAQGLLVSPEYFQILGVEQGQGRYFTSDEGVGPGEHPVVVLTHPFWLEVLGGDPGILGSDVMLNRKPYTVVGVTPPGFRGHIVGAGAELFVPIVQQPDLDGIDLLSNRDASWHLMLGALSPEATVEQLNQQLAAVGEAMAGGDPDGNAGGSFRAVALGAVPATMRPVVRIFVVSLLAMVALILLVTCTNVAGMFVARSLAREREVAVRTALGASRGRLVRLLTLETLIVFLAGGGAGAWLGAEAVGLLRADRLPIPELLHLDLTPDPSVLLVTLAVTLLTGLLFGLLPAAQATRLDVIGSLKGQDAGSRGRAGNLRRVFAASQVGLSLVVVVGAGLFARSLQQASRVDPGLEPAGVYTVGMDLTLEGYDGSTGPLFQERLLNQLATLGWVESVALSQDLPLDMASRGTAVLPEGWGADPDRHPLQVGVNAVTPAYFETLGIPVLAGRVFEPGDRADGELVAVVTQTFVDEVFPGESPVGRVVRSGPTEDSPAHRIVGVVGDTKNTLITEPDQPFVYFSLAQSYASDTRVSVRADLPPEVVIPRIREALLEVDPRLALAEVIELERYVRIGLLPQRLAAGFMSFLGLVAILLSALGIYGVISYNVGRQVREIGIRMALGAEASAVALRYLRQGLLLSLPGLALGALVAVALAQFMSRLLLGVSPLDPVALGLASALLLGTVTLASWIPARRASRVEPREAIRSE